jgi:hypothetical protein
MRFDEVMGLDRTGRLSSIRTTSARCPGARSPRSRSPTARAGLVETTVFLIDTLSRVSSDSVSSAHGAHRKDEAARRSGQVGVDEANLTGKGRRHRADAPGLRFRINADRSDPQS